MNRWLMGAWTLLAIALPACDDGPQEPDLSWTVAVSPGTDTLNAIGDTLELTATVSDDVGRILPTVEVEWSSLDGGIATVDEFGRVVGREEGWARIQARAEAAADTAQVLVRAGVPTAELRFVRFAEGAPDFVTRDTSFWAVRGEDRMLTLRYAPEPGDNEGEEFLELRVSAQSLWQRPDGTPFADGDSIRITVAIEDSLGFAFRFGPSGLRFEPERPARLKITYRYAEHDLDGDGDVDDEDREVEDRLAVWRQEQPDLPWMQLFSVKFDDLDEIEALIDGFTGFALASN